MSKFQPLDPEFETKVRGSFARQSVMKLIGARLGRVDAGEVEVELPYREDLTQQHDYLHAGITTTIADSAGGYAAYSLMPENSSVLSIEFKVNLVAPAKGERFLATGKVVRPGKRVTVCQVEVLAIDGDSRKTCLVGLQTIMCLADRSDSGHA